MDINRMNEIYDGEIQRKKAEERRREAEERRKKQNLTQKEHYRACNKFFASVCHFLLSVFSLEIKELEDISINLL